jgi:Protein of unknown function (DUF3667)
MRPLGQEFLVENPVVAGQPASMSSDHPAAPEHTHCQNCGVALQGPFCHVCGQRDLEFHRSFHHLLHEAVETLLHIDLSVGRGCFDLLFRPGRMTREFNEGRRARHVPPLRFYLVISLLFFLMFSLHSVRLDLRITFGNLEVKGDASTLKPQTQEGTISREVEERIIGSLRQPDQLVERFVHRLPKAMAVCVPLFALFSRLLFWPGPWSYLQHLILAVHLHSFAFLWIMVVSGYERLAGLVWPAASTVLGWAGFLYAVIYFFAALRHTLGASRWTTLWKGATLVASYSVVLVVAVAATIVLSLLWA